MKRNWHRIMLGFAFLGGLITLGPSCVVRATPYVYNLPPAPRYRVQVTPRAGYVYVRGRYYRRGGAWVWRRGHYKRVRRGQYWRAGKWRYYNGRYRWAPGAWSAGGYARVAPPSRRSVRVVPRTGHYYVRGRYYWTGRRWAWKRGHYRVRRRRHRGQRWVRGRYVVRGGRYVWIRGYWRR